MQVTVRYGLEQETVEVPDGSRFRDLRGNPNLRASLGFGDNVKFLLNGVEMPGDATVPYGAYVTVETAANQKAMPLAA